MTRSCYGVLVLLDERWQLAEHLLSLGVQPLFSFPRKVREGEDLERRLARYGALNADFIKTSGGDKFPKAIYRRRAAPRSGRLQ